MAKFYNPKIMQVRNIPLIVYPSEGIEKLLDREKQNPIKDFFNILYTNKNLKNIGKFNINILWENKGDLMTDIWIYSQLNNWKSGALVDEKTFRNYKIDNTIGITAEFGLIMLGEEAKYRLIKKPKDYFEKRPQLPTQIMNNINF